MHFLFALVAADQRDTKCRIMKAAMNTLAWRASLPSHLARWRCLVGCLRRGGSDDYLIKTNLANKITTK